MSHHNHRSRMLAAVLLSGGLLLSAVFFAWSGVQARTHSAQAQLVVPVTTVAAPTPSVTETKPVPASSVHPVSLEMATIHKTVPIVNVGLTATGNMDVPNNFIQSGWYDNGPVPGQQGSAVLAAHVDNGGFKPTVSGVFKHIDQLKSGDVLTITMSDGSLVLFKVLHIDVYETNAFPSEQVFEQNNGAYLKLITCHGIWAPSIHTYNQRLVVTAERVNL